jgi:hypothetical protein
MEDETKKIWDCMHDIDTLRTQFDAVCYEIAILKDILKDLQTAQSCIQKELDSMRGYDD